VSSPKKSPQSFSSDLPDYIDEDDLSLNEIAEEEENAALLYELSRHVPHVADTVLENFDALEHFRRHSVHPFGMGGGTLNLPIPEGDELSRRVAEHEVSPEVPEGPLRNVDPAILTFLAGFEGFPDSGWIHLPGENRAKRMFLYRLLNEKSVIDQSHLLEYDESDDPSQWEGEIPQIFQEYARHYAPELGFSHELHLISVDWRKRNSQILKELSQLIEKMRPAWKEEPRGAPRNTVANVLPLCTSAQQGLRYLEVWRKKHFHRQSWEDAVPEPNDPSSFKVEANKFIRRLRSVALRLFPEE
tara:strand:- start:88 stop:990 length:903 start_codon:yes stop_codon:yes gene_type:complete